MKVELTQELLKEYITYDELTGELTWIQRPSRNSCCRVGDRVGSLTVKNGYQAQIFKNRLYASSIIWLYMFDKLPATPIVHIDGNASNDSLINLEEEYLIDVNNLTQTILQEVFDYNSESGIMLRKVCLGGGFKKGDRAGSLHTASGYRRIFIQGNSFDEHLLIWMYMTGEGKEDLLGFEIDHENRIRSDNRWDNLRKATRNQNQHNATLRIDSPLGIKGLTITSNSTYKAQVDAYGIKNIKYFNLKEKRKQ